MIGLEVGDYRVRDGYRARAKGLEPSRLQGVIRVKAEGKARHALTSAGVRGLRVVARESDSASDNDGPRRAPSAPGPHAPAPARVHAAARPGWLGEW